MSSLCFYAKHRTLNITVTRGMHCALLYRHWKDIRQLFPWNKTVEITPPYGWVKMQFFIIVAHLTPPLFFRPGDSFSFIHVISRLSAFRVTTRSEPILWHARKADNYHPRVWATKNSLVPPLHDYDPSYRSWTIRLFRDASLFSKDVSFESTSGPISFDTSHSYVGTVLGKSIYIFVIDRLHNRSREV